MLLYSKPQIHDENQNILIRQYKILSLLYKKTTKNAHRKDDNTIYLISKILTSFLPLASLILTTSPTFFPLIAIPIGDSKEILIPSLSALSPVSNSIAVSQVPTMTTVNFPSPSISRVTAAP
jgi:hypothetical protein